MLVRARVGRRCPDSVPVLLERYALRGQEGGRGTREFGGEDADCHREIGIGCVNQSYKRTGERVFRAYGPYGNGSYGTAASDLFDWAVGRRMLDSYREGIAEYNRQYFGVNKHYGRGENEFVLIHTGEYRPDLGSETDGSTFWCTQDVDFNAQGALKAFFHTMPGHDGNQWCPIGFAATPAKGPYRRAYAERGYCFLGRECRVPE